MNSGSIWVSKKIYVHTLQQASVFEKVAKKDICVCVVFIFQVVLNISFFLSASGHKLKQNIFSYWVQIEIW